MRGVLLMALTESELADTGYLLCLAFDGPAERSAAEERLAIATERCELDLRQLGLLAGDPDASPDGVTFWSSEYAKDYAKRRDRAESLADAIAATEALAAMQREEVAA